MTIAIKNLITLLQLNRRQFSVHADQRSPLRKKMVEQEEERLDLVKHLSSH